MVIGANPTASWHLGVEAHVDREAGAHHRERVAVGCCLGAFGVGDVAAGAGLVIDVELLAARYRQFLRDDARDHVGWATGGEAAQNAHRTIGVTAARVLRGRVLGNEQSCAESKQAHHGRHDVLT